jgi:hypothetical protein
MMMMNNKRIVLPSGTWSTESTISPDGTIARNVLARGFYKKLGLAIALGGGDQGFNEAADVIEQTIDGVDTNELWNAYQQAVALRNREREPLVNFLSWFVTEPVEGIATADSDARFERASEYGVPRSFRPAGEIEFFGYDFNWYDLGSRFTWEFLADAPAAQVDAINTQALEADSILMFQLVMWTLFNPNNREALIRKKPYNVYAFWNGDGQVPPTYRTNTFAGTHTHYYRSGSTVLDPGDWANASPGDVDELEVKLTEHGYKGSNGYNLILMVNKEQGDIIRGFRSVQNGGTSKWDFIPAQGTPAFLIPRDYVLPTGQTAPPANLAGMEVIGRYGEFTVVQEDYIPPKYLVAFATGGPESVNNPIGIRQHANPALRGLRLVKGRDADYPLTEAYYQRGIGTGIRKRGAGAVLQLAAAGAYTAPTEYDEEP